MTLRTHLVSQFRAPRGLVGRLAGQVMAHRPSNRARNLWTVDVLDLAPAHRVLEIGCGPGIALEAVAQRVTAGEIWAIDHSALMVTEAQARNRGAVSSGRMHIVRGATEAMPSGLDGFDRIYSVNVVQFWAEPAQVFTDLASRLNPGGLLATTYMPRSEKASAADASAMAEKLLSWMDQAGFSDTRAEYLPLRPVPAVCVIGSVESGAV